MTAVWIHRLDVGHGVLLADYFVEGAVQVSHGATAWSAMVRRCAQASYRRGSHARNQEGCRDHCGSGLLSDSFKV